MRGRERNAVSSDWSESKTVLMIEMRHVWFSMCVHVAITVFSYHVSLKKIRISDVRHFAGVNLQMCRLWFQEFLIQSKKHYRAELESVDFKTRSEEVRIDVNHWVQQHTPGGSHLHMYTQSLHIMSSSSSHVFHKQDSLLLLSPSKVRSVHL